MVRRRLAGLSFVALAGMLVFAPAAGAQQASGIAGVWLLRSWPRERIAAAALAISSLSAAVAALVAGGARSSRPGRRGHGRAPRASRGAAA